MKSRKQSRNFHFEEDVFTKSAQDIAEIMHEVLLSIKFLPTKPQVKRVNTNYSDLCYTFCKNRD